MSTMIELVAALTRLPKTLQKGATGWRGGVTVWPSKYDGGDPTGSAAIQVGAGDERNVFELYFAPKVMEQYADITSPTEVFKWSLAVNIAEGNPRFAVVAVSEPGKRDAVSTVARVTLEAPVIAGMSGGALEVLFDAEAEHAMRVVAPAGMAWNPDLGALAGSLLPVPLEVEFQRRLQTGTTQPPMRARAVNCDARMLVSAHPVADLDALAR